MANYIRNLSAIAGAFFLCFALIGTISPASAAGVYTFKIYDHPAGNQVPAGYGLRLDSGPNDHNFFSFEQDPADTAAVATSIARLVVDTDANTARIVGDVQENFVNGGGNVQTERLWTIEYDFDVGLDIDESTGAFTATSGSGTLTTDDPDTDPLPPGTDVPGPDSISLTSKAKMGGADDGLAMIFRADGHRVTQAHADAGLLPLNCAPTTCWVGRGWIMGDDTNDFLFIATLESFQETVVPLPAALPLLLSGLGLMGWFSRRRKRAVAAA